MYGGVSIVTDAFDTPIASFERDSEADVYAFIISELEAVKNILPVQPNVIGRATKGATEHLLSLVYLSRGYTSFAGADDFKKAEEYASNVIENPSYNLLPNFENVFKPGNEDNREIVFAIQFDRNSLINGVGGHCFAYLVKDENEANKIIKLLNSNIYKFLQVISLTSAPDNGLPIVESSISNQPDSDNL